MDKKQQTIDTYNATAEQMAAKFEALGAYPDLAETFELVQKVNPVVLEIGCGSGRDAAEIVKCTTNYTGIDVSEKFIEIAKRHVPQGVFIVADVESYEFKPEIDIVFAFASLIHVPKDSLAHVFERIYGALRVGGVMRASFKCSDAYQEVTRTDEFGTRTYYHYSQQDIAEITKQFSALKNEVYELRDQKWIKLVLQKV